VLLTSERQFSNSVQRMTPRRWMRSTQTTGS